MNARNADINDIIASVLDGVRIDNTREMPSGANSAGKTVYVDKHIPRYDNNLLMPSGRPLDLHIPLAIHEMSEEGAMAKGMKYAQAHKNVATPLEHAYVASKGVDPKHYEAVMRGYLDETEHERVKTLPRGLHVDPKTADRGKDDGPGGDGDTPEPFTYTPEPTAALRKRVGNALLDATGLPDARRALRGEMTPDEAQHFLFASALGALPGGRMENMLTKAAGAFHGTASPLGEGLGTIHNIATALKGDVPSVSVLPTNYHTDLFPEGAIQDAAKYAWPDPHAWKSGGGTYARRVGVATVGDDVAAGLTALSKKAKPAYSLEHVGVDPDEEDYFVYSPSGEKVAEITHQPSSGEWAGEQDMWHLATEDGGHTALFANPHEAASAAQAYHEKLMELGPKKATFAPGVAAKFDEPASIPAQERAHEYEEHIEPLDWHTLAAKQPAGFDDFSTRMEAQRLGFNPLFPLWKGGARTNYPSLMPNPLEKGWERGLFFSDKPVIARDYTRGGGTPLEYVARAEKPMTVDWKSATGLDEYSGHHMGPIIEAARKKGADLLEVRGLHDIGGHQNQYVVLDPSIVRAPTAAFNPARLHEADPLATIAGLAAGGSALTGLYFDDNNNPVVKTK